MSIIENLSARKRARQQTSQEKYRATLHRIAVASNPTEADELALDALSSELILSVDDVATHLEAIKIVNELTPVAMKMDDAKRASKEAGHARNEFEKKYQDAIRSLNDEREMHNVAILHAHSEIAKCGEAQNEIEGLKRLHPNLF